MPEEPTPVQELNYEQALAELESVVEALETGQPSLEESLVLFERGQSLAKRCAGLLDQAELRIQTLAGQEPDLPSEDEDQA